MATALDFEYVAPASLEEALAELGARDGDVKVLAGGQSLVPLLNYRLARPSTIVDINGLPLAGISMDDGWLRIGALTRHVTLQHSPEIRAACPVLADAAALIGNVRVRTLGTLGGSLAHADPAGELPMVMVALDARLTLRRRGGRRIVAARDFFTGILTTTLGADELLTEVEVPLTSGAGYAVEEFARRAGDFALVAVTALVRIDRRGRVDDARLAIGGVGPVPVRSIAAEEGLRGQEPTAERLAQVAGAAARALDPVSDAFASGSYRRHLTAILTRRVLTGAVARAMEAA